MAAALKLVTEQVSPVEVPYPLLLCMDRAIGHDWNHHLTWRDGSDIHRGRWTYFQYERVGRCTQCGSERIEIFETDHKNERVYKLPGGRGNRYRYSDVWKNRPRLEQAEVRARLRRAS